MKAFESMGMGSALAVSAVVTALLLAWFAHSVNDAALRGQAVAAAAPHSAVTIAGDGETLVVMAERLPKAHFGAALPKSAKADRQPN